MPKILTTSTKLAWIVPLAFALMAQTGSCVQSPDTEKIAAFVSEKLAGAEGANFRIVVLPARAPNFGIVDASPRRRQAVDHLLLDSMLQLATHAPRAVPFRVGSPPAGSAATPVEFQMSKMFQEIYWDANLDRMTKANRLMKEVAAPLSADAILTSMVSEANNGGITLRWFFVLAQNSGPLSDAIELPAGALDCTNPRAPSQPMVCEPAQRQIFEKIFAR